jgi:5-methylcytosine-specific restriction endonuclease McrA
LQPAESEVTLKEEERWMKLHDLRTLVLDAAFRPLHAIRWQRAMVLDLLDRVDVLEYYDAVVRTSTDAFPLPAVVRHRAFVQRGPRRVALTRGNLLARDGCRCQYCGEAFASRELTIDHVLPRSKGGPSTWENLVIACGPCNRRKGDKTPAEAGMPLLTRPRRPMVLTMDRDGLFTGAHPSEWEEYLPA